MTNTSRSIRRKSTFSNQTYDVLKFIAQILLPALGTFYFALAGIWNFPDAGQVIGTITALDTLLGVLLGISTTNYQSNRRDADGQLVIDKRNPNKDTYSLELTTGLDQIERQDRIVLKVHKS